MARIPKKIQVNLKGIDSAKKKSQAIKKKIKVTLQS